MKERILISLDGFKKIHRSLIDVLNGRRFKKSKIKLSDYFLGVAGLTYVNHGRNGLSYEI